MANVNYAELTLAANTVGLLKAKTDLAAVTTAGAKTEAGIKKSMKGVESAVKPVPQAARDAAAGMKDLRMSLDPLYASSKKYEAVQKQVAAAVKKGAATQAEANRIMALAEDRYLGMGGAAEVAATRMGNGAGGLAHQSRMAAMQLSQVAQQTAATGNFIQALSIQLPDLALGFGALGIGIGVVAGALLPLAANFVTGGEGAMELSDALDNASSELAEYIDLMSQSDALGAERFERTRGQIELTSQAYADLIAIAKIEAFNSIEDLNAALVDSAVSASWLKTQMADVGRLLEINTTNASNITIWKENRAQVRAFISELEALRDASSLEEQYAAALQLRDAFKQTVDVNGDLTEEQLAFWKTLSQSIQKMEVMGAAIEAQASGMSKVEQAAAKAAQQYAKSRIEGEKSAAAASELLSQLQQEAKVRSLTLRYGADSVQVANARLEAERRSFVTQVQARDISESLKRELIAAWDAANGAASASAGLSGKLSQASAFAAQLVANLGQVRGAVAAIAGQVDSAINSLQTQNRSLTYQLEQGITASAAAIKAQRDEALKLAAENGATIEQLAALGQSFDEQAAKAEELATANNAMTKTLSDQAAAAAKAAAGASGAGKAMKEAAKEAGRFAKEVERLEFDADPLKKYNAELANLNELAANGLSDGAYAHAVAELNDEFANSDPMISKAGDAIADFVAGGMRDFGDLLGAFKNMLKEMIATAIANPIKLALVGGVSGGGLAGTAAQAAAPGGGGMMGGMLGGVGSGIGSIMGAAGTGFMSSVGGFMSGGLSGGFGAIGAQLSATAAGGFGLSSVAASIGAVAAPLLAVAAVFSFFSSKTKLLDKGLRITADATSTLVEEFEKIEKSRFWGLSKSKSTTYSPFEDDGPILDAVDAIKDSALEMGEVLGLSADNFASFSTKIKISLKDLSDEEAQAAIQEAFGTFSREFSYAALGHFQEELGNVIREGETADQALAALANSFTTVNEALNLIDATLLDVGVASGVAARDLVELAGGLEAFAGKTQFMFANMLTDVEQDTKRAELAMSALTSTFGQLGLSIPQTHAEFLALAQAQDLTTAAGRETYAALLEVSSAFVTLYGTAQQAADGINGLSKYISSLGKAVATNAAAVFDAEAALAQAEATLGSAISNLAGAVSTAMAEADRRLEMARSGLDGAFRDLSGAIDREVSSLADALNKAESKVSDALGNAFDAIDRQIEALENSMDNASTAAEKAGRLFEMLRDALDERRVGTLAEERLTRARAMAELSAGITDEDRMAKVLGVLSEPSEHLFGSFTDYARDFARTSNLIQQQRDAQEGQLSEAEQQLSLMQDQIDAFEAQKDELQRQYDALMGIDQSVLSVADAVAAFQDASTSYTQQEAHNEQRNAELQAIREHFDISADATLSVATAIDALATAQATLSDEQAWHTERMSYLQSLIDKYDLQMTSTDALTAAIKAVESAVDGVATAVADVELAIDTLAESIIAAIQTVSGTKGLIGMGSDAFSDYSDDRTNAIFSEDGSNLLTGTAKAINDIYEDVFGRAADAAGLKFYGELIDSGATSLDRVQYNLMTSGEMASGVTPGFSGGFTEAKTIDPVSALYTIMLGKDPDPKGVDFWRSTGLEGEELINAFREGAIANGEVPAFARGGLHSGGLALVGEQGPELVNMGPSRVYSNPQTKEMMRGDPEVRKELVKLNEYIRELVKVNNKQERRLREIELQGETA